MAVKPLDDTIARYSMWGGTAIALTSRLFDSENAAILFFLGMFFIIIGLVTLPAHPEHYLDYSKEKGEE
jgi:multidrug transporter EmrE-like cation transporter